MDLTPITVWATIGFLVGLSGVLYLFYYAIREIYLFITYRFHPDAFGVDDLGEIIALVGWACAVTAALYFILIFAPFDINFTFDLKVQ